MPEAYRHRYWIDRFTVDSQRLSEEQQVELHRAFLRIFCELTEDELAVFTDPNSSFGTKDLDNGMIFLAAERRVSDYFLGEYPDRESEEYDSMQRSAEAYQYAFGEILTGIYTPEEIGEIILHIVDPWDWGTLRVLIAGVENWLGRRIRNAYLPSITDLVADGQDVGDEFFDGPDDAVAQIDRLMGNP